MAKGYKTGGRVKGTSNKVTEKIRGVFTKVIENYVTDSIENDLKTLSPDQRLKVIMHLSEFVIPKMLRTESEKELNAEKSIEIKFIRASDCQKEIH